VLRPYRRGVSREPSRFLFVPEEKKRGTNTLSQKGAGLLWLAFILKWQSGYIAEGAGIRFRGTNTLRVRCSTPPPKKRRDVPPEGHRDSGVDGAGEERSTQ